MAATPKNDVSEATYKLNYLHPISESFSSLIIALYLHTHTGSNHRNKIFINTAEQALLSFYRVQQEDRARG